MKRNPGHLSFLEELLTPIAIFMLFIICPTIMYRIVSSDDSSDDLSSHPKEEDPGFPEYPPTTAYLA